MTPKERLIQALIKLCSKHGVEDVAERARVSPENLRQILNGVRLPSGKPRGVGPQLQEKLERAYPNWAASSEPPLPPPRFQDRHDVSETDWGLLQAVKTVLSEREQEDIRRRAAEIEKRVEERLASIRGGR